MDPGVKAGRSARLQRGFRDEPDCFQIVRYTLDKDEWLGGFAIIE